MNKSLFRIGATLVLLMLLPAGTLWAAVPNPPSGLTATALSAVQIRLDWTDNSTDETHFYIERKTGAGGTYTVVGNVGANVTTYTNTGLAQNTTYYYRVRAYNSSNNVYSTYSNEASATTRTLNAPTNLSVSAVSYAQVTLTWTDNSSEETGFSIERKTGAGGTYTQIASVGANATSFTNTGLAQGTEYYYRVRAVSGSNYSEYSNEVSATTLTLNAPSGLTVTPLSAVQIRLDWTDNSTDETYFYIERKTGAAGTWSQIASVSANITTYTNTGLAQNTTYYYRVRAYNSSNNVYSTYSNEASATTPSLNSPSNLSATAINSTQIKLTWTDNSSEETGFSIERKTGAGGTYTQIASVGANVTTYTNTGLTHGIEYYYRVRAVSGSNYSEYSNEAGLTLKLSAPSNLTATSVTPWDIQLTWNDNSVDETAFYIEYRVEGTDSFTALPSLVANTTSYIHSALLPGISYHYRVRAYNSGGYSAYSNEASATTLVEIPAGASDSAGNEFFIAFQPNTVDGVSNLSLFITSQQDTRGVVTIPGLSFSQAFDVQANNVTTVIIPSEAQSLGSNNITRLGVRVAAQKEITVYGLNQRQYTTDAFMALPVDILGLEYLAMSYNGPSASVPSQVAVIGVYDNTRVTITPSADATGRAAGVPFTITLNRHDTFQLTGIGTNDLTGTIISASSPVAVMSGVNCVNVPVGVPWCDHIVEMMPPVTTWGKSFLTVPLATRLKGDVFRILASQDNTTVTINGAPAATLNRGKFLEKVLTARSQIEASAPVLVAQYSPGQNFDGVVSDPFMMLIPPTEQFLNQYTFSTPASGFTANFVNIVVPTTAISSLRLDGLPISSTLFSPIGSSGFSGAQVPISLGSHTITGNVPFGIHVYGFGSYDSYGYPGGMAFEFINPIGDAYLPNVKLTQIGDSIQGLATDSEDINANGVLDPGEDLNGNGTIDRRSEDVNGNGVLDPSEDLNGNGYLDRDMGIFKVELDPESTNLRLSVTSFIPGALSVNFSITLIDPNVAGTGVVRISDSAGNVVQTPVFLSKFPVLRDVRIISTISTNGIELDPASFSKPPYSITTSSGQTVIEWRFKHFPVNLQEDIGFDVILKNPIEGEQRLVSRKLELLYNDVNGNSVRTELGPQYVNVLNSAFESAISTDKPVYQANEDVIINARLKNLSGYARTIDAKVLIEDSGGNIVKEVATLLSLTFDAGEVKNSGNLVFNTGSTYSGDYRVRLLLYETQKTIGEASSNFRIQPPTIALNAKVVVDKLMYGPNENVTITSTVTSRSANYIFENLTARITVARVMGQGSGDNIYTETKTIGTLMPEASFTFNAYWNTGMYAPGTYPVTLEVKDASGAVISTSSASLVISSDIMPSAALKGRISVDRQSLMAGEPVAVTYSVTNVGNSDLADVALSVQTVHVVNQTVYDSLSSQTALAMGEMYTGSWTIDTTASSAMDYLVVLRANINGVEETLAGTYFRVEGAPTAPALISPAMGSDADTATPSLLVSNASDPNDDTLTYEFELYADAGLSQLVASSGRIAEGTGTTAWTASVSLTENSTYYWRARAYDGKLYGPWMDKATCRVNVINDPPTAPEPLSPADTTSVSVLAPTLTVTNATDPDSTNLTYNFQVALDPDFTQIVATTNGIFEGQGTTSWQVSPALTENTWYYWRAQADDWQIEGPWSRTGKFFVDTANDPPSKPMILSPASNAVVTSLDVDVVLQNSTDFDSPVILYYCEIDIVPSFDSASIIRSGLLPQGPETTTCQATGLMDNTLYYVRAMATDGSAESGWTEPAIKFFVNTANDAPTTPVIANPSNGAGVSVSTPTLTVHNSTDLDRDALTYEFEVFTDAAFTSRVAGAGGIAETTGTTSWTVTIALTENQKYYWRVRAFDGSLYSDWAEAWFVVNIANDAPGAPALSSPAAGSSVATLMPTLAVLNASDPDSDVLTYDFELYHGTTLVWSRTAVPQDPSGMTAVTVTTALADNTTYQWRARAYDGDRYGPWMTMAMFSIHIPKMRINTTIDFDPNTLNKTSSGTWVVVYIELPAGYKPADVDISTVRMEGSIPAVLRPTAIGDYDKDGIPDLMVKFKRSDVIAVLPVGDQVSVHVSGTVGTTTFEGVDIIRVIK